MSVYPVLDTTELVKIESTAGTNASPVVGTDAILMENAQVGFPDAVNNTDESTGSLDPRAGAFAGGPAPVSGRVYLKGSGAAGTTPEYDDLLRASGLASSNSASALTGTAQAGAASTITLDASETGVLLGMPIDLTGGTGSGQRRWMTAWDNGTKVATVFPAWTTQPDATSIYSLPAGQHYVPTSTLETATVYQYQHRTDGGNSRLKKALGCMFNCQFSFGVRGLVTMDFTGSGVGQLPTDVSPPSAPTYQSQRPVSFMGATLHLEGFGGTAYALQLNQATLDLGNQVVHPDDPAATYGVGVAQVVRRRIAGRINPVQRLLSVHDVISDFLAGTTREAVLDFGAAGNRIALYIPQLTPLGSADENINGLRHEGIPFNAQGDDAGFYLYVH